MEKILITGGAGFIGSYCVEKFKNEGYSVTVLDNFSTTGQNDNDKIFEDINLIKGDILDYKWDVRLSEDEEKILVGDYKVRNEYSVSKLLSEIVLSNTSKVSNLKYQIIRPFNISGARQQVVGGFVLPTFVTQSLKDEDITVFGDGEQIRAFTHVKDIVDGIYLISQYEDGNEIWNIGNPNNECTIKELADLVKQKINTASEIKLVDPKTIHGPLYEEAWDKVPEPSKIKKMLNWKPKYDIDYIVDDVIEYFKNK